MNNNQIEFHRRVKNFIASIPKDLQQPAGKAVFVDQAFSDDILPFELYKNTRQQIQHLADQINKAYYFEIYDGCAVLMRRLLEILIILSFKNNGIEESIRDVDGNYLQLSEIVDIAKKDRTLDLSRNAKEYLDPFREKGNLSAHNPFHKALRKDLELYQPKYRHLIQELLYKAGIIQ